MKKAGNSVLSLIFRGLLYLSLFVVLFGCGMLFQFLTSDDSTFWREGSQSTFIWLIVIGAVGAGAFGYLSSRFGSPNNPTDVAIQAEEQLADNQDEQSKTD